MTRPRLRLFAGPTACVLLGVGLQLAGAPAAAAPVAGTLTASTASPVMVAEQVTLDGSLPPARARTVRLQRRVDAGGWTVVETKKSRTNGTFRFTPVIPSSAVTQVGYRVLAPATTLGGVAYGEVETPSVILDVTAQDSSLHVPSRVLVGSTYTVEAIFSPARAGRAVLLQRRSGGSWTNLATTTQDATGTAVFPRPATTLGVVTLRATAQSYRGAAIRRTATVTVDVLGSGDVAPPGVPHGLHATYDAGRVELSWDAVGDGDLSGYRVHRAATRNGPWALLTVDPVTTTRFVDTEPSDPASSWYTVTSTDTAGNHSGRAPPTQPAEGDLTPPGVPTGLGATAGDGEVALSWEPGSDQDLAGYQVYRSDTGTGTGPWAAVGSPVTTPSATVTGLTNGVAVFFTVTTLDTAGHESARAPAVEATPQPSSPPDPGPDDGTTHPGGTYWLDRTLSDDAIRESSGLALSSYDPTLLWTHNDSGSSPTIFAVTKAGTTAATYTVGTTVNRDWEDISAGPGGTLWIGDIGDNNRVRSSISVHQVVEPESPVTGTLDASTYTFTYPDGPQNAETLMVNPVSGRLYVVSKAPSGTPGAIYAAPEALTTTEPNPLTRLGSVPSRITAGDWAPDGESFMLRTPTEGYLYSSLDDTSPAPLVLPAMRLGESLAYSTKPSMVYLGSEGLDSPVYRMATGLSDDGTSMEPPLPSPPATPPPTATMDARLGWSPTAPTRPTGGVLRPEDFGATGDGTTDDSAALQLAVDHAATLGASLELAADTTYRLESQLLLPSGTYLHGAGSSSVLAFTWTENDDDHDGLYLGNKDQLTGNHDITLDSFAIQGAGTGEPEGPKSMQANPNVPGIRFRLVDRFQISRLEISQVPGISLLNQGSSNGVILDNYVHHSGRDGINTGWFRQGGHRILIADNLVTKVGDDGIAILGANGDGDFTDVWTHHVAAVGNTVQGWSSNINGLAIGRGIAVLGVTETDVFDNTVDMTHSNGVLVGPAVDRTTNVVYRSADVRFVGNVVANAGQLYVGADPTIHEPGHEGVFVNRSDRISFVATTVTNPYGQPMLFDRCSCTSS